MSSFIPDSAPFSEQQRAWLSGFFSGLAGIDPQMSPSATIAAAGIATEQVAACDDEEDQDYPWHDSTLPIVDRMELADGKPLERRLMAAMAQLDCGSCGYLCKTYSEAIASGEESNLTLCSPGGKETKQMIKKLIKENEGGTGSNGSTGGNGATQSASPSSSSTSGDWSRQNPFTAKLVESRALNKQGSAKDTQHVVIDLAGSDMTYDVGDALGVYPTNCRSLASMIIQKIAADAELAVDSPLGSRKQLMKALVEDCCLKDPSDELVALLMERAKSSKAKESLQSLVDHGVPDGCDVLDVLKLAGDAPVAVTEFIETLEPLNPRLYSIASSMKEVGTEVHLTVGKVLYEREGRMRKGVASTMLAERVGRGENLRVFVQPNHGGFTVPANPDAPMVMIGPGTGVAPFIAFLQERNAVGAKGRNWLFFGDQHRATDFLYERMLEDYSDRGLLTRLDTAFSRDGASKIYVQDRMRAEAAELWQWIQQGAFLFVCGDATRMASDVHQALIDIVAEQGEMSVDKATNFVEELKVDGRYVRDVY